MALLNLSYAAVAVLAALLARYIYIVLKHPSAPGAFLGRWTSAYYAWQVWSGHFEKWNIKQHALHGKVIRIGPYMYSINDPAAVKPLYGVGTAAIKSSWYSFSGDIRVKNDNIFSTQDPTFHSQMKRRQAAFYSMSSIKSYEPYVDLCVAEFKRQFERLSRSGEVFNIQVWSQSYAFDTVSQMTFGVREGFTDNGSIDTSVFKDTWNLQTFVTMAGITSPWGLPFLLMRFGNPVAGLLRYVGRLSAKAEEHKKSTDPEKTGSAQPTTFLSKVQADGKAHPVEHQKFRTFTVMQANIAAGSDTTSIAMTSILYNSARHPKVWARLRSEIAEAINAGQVSEPITYAQSVTLPYLQAVIKESLRFHPSIGLPLWRVIPKGGAEIAGVRFPAGTWVGINPWVANRNTDVFGSDAGQFNPDRYLPFPHETPEQTKQRLEKMEAYFLTFGSGSRTCVGKWISLLEIGKLIPEIVRAYELELDSTAGGVEGSEEAERVNNWFVKQTNAWARVIKKPVGE